MKFIGTLKFDGSSGKWSFDTKPIGDNKLPTDPDLVHFLRHVADRVEADANAAARRALN